MWWWSTRVLFQAFPSVCWWTRGLSTYATQGQMLSRISCQLNCCTLSIVTACHMRWSIDLLFKQLVKTMHMIAISSVHCCWVETWCIENKPLRPSTDWMGMPGKSTRCTPSPHFTASPCWEQISRELKIFFSTLWLTSHWQGQRLLCLLLCDHWDHLDPQPSNSKSHVT